MDLTGLPLWGNVLVFTAAAAIVWVAGVRVARLADELARATGMGSAVVGVILLAGITSLPELAATITATAQGAPTLAANNLLGGLAFQVAIIAVADAVIRDDALTAVNARPVVILQGALDCVMLTVVALAIAVGDLALPFGIGAWSLGLVLVYVVAVVMVARFRGSGSWQPAEHTGNPRESLAREQPPARPVRSLVVRIAGAAAAVLAAGVAATMAAEALAEQTGLGTSFVGAVLLAGATSLPELSTAIEAVRLRRYTMAFGDIFGTNLIDVALIVLIDIVGSGPPVLGELGVFSQVAALLGVLLTLIYVVGLIERRDRVILRMGVDSVLVIVTYFAGLVLLYHLRAT